MFSINTSCKKKDAGDCWTPDTAYYDFNITEVGKIPYTGFDTLKFKNEATGIVYTFIGQGIDTSLTYSQRWFPDMCPEEFQKCQSKKFKYVAPNFQYPIFIQAFMPFGNRSSADLSIRFEGVDYSKDLGTVGFAGYSDTINGQVYHNINNLKETDNNWTNHIKYNTTEGILKIVYENKIYSKQK
jgi:hypothetical protein